MSEITKEHLPNDEQMHLLAEHEVYLLCMKHGIRYFGPYLHALQGSTRRHIYMQAIVQKLVTQNGGKPLRILEVGSWAGGSTVTWALALKQFSPTQGTVVCVDSWAPFGDMKTAGAGSIYDIMRNAGETGEIQKLFRNNVRAMGVADIVMPFQGASSNILPLFAPDSFDIIYLDGDHAYQGILADIKNAKGLLRDGGILAGDDLELQLHEVDQEHNQAHLSADYIEDPKTKQSYHPGVCRAVGEVFGPLSCFEGLWAVQKSKDSYLPIELDNAEKFKIPPHLVDSAFIITSLFIDNVRSRPSRVD